MEGGIIIVICLCGLAISIATPIFRRGAGRIHQNFRIGTRKMNQKLIVVKKQIRHKSFIKSTNTINWEGKDKYSYKINECIICFNDYSENNKCSELYCGHKFHNSCIKEWMNCREICPLCNTKLIKKKWYKNS